MQKNVIDFIKNKALSLRIDSLRATTASESGHPTSCFSVADIIATLFFKFLRYDTKNPHYINNDRLILSKGHAIPVIYAAWKALGIISDEELLSLRKFESVFEGHPTPRFAYNEAATGSLGQGLAVGVGMALNAKMSHLDYTTYVILGDGEIAEGSNWEAAALGAHYELNNLIGIIDCNKYGQSGPTLHQHDVEKYAKKFQAFGWHSIIINGNNISEIIKALEEAHNIKQPVMIIAKTIKGFGLEGIEDVHQWHGKPVKKEDLETVISKVKQRFSQQNTIQDQTYIPPLPTQGTTSQTTQQRTTITLATDAHTSEFDPQKKLSTRKAYGYALAALGKANTNIISIDADVQNSTFSEFFNKEFPDRFIECFIAEQAMIGIATGLHIRGKVPFASTFGAFFSRAYDQIRMAGIGQNALRLCGSHCGISIGQDGPSQMALEDIAMMAAIPNSAILYPSDGVSTYKLTECSANYHQGVSYLRTTRSDTPIIYEKTENFSIGGCKILQKSTQDKACLVAAGITVHEALKAYQALKKQNIFVSVIDAYSVKPLDTNTIVQTAKASNNNIITIEDHYLYGGLGQIVAREISNHGISITNLAVTNVSRSGKPEELFALAGINADNIIKTVLNMAAKK